MSAALALLWLATLAAWLLSRRKPRAPDAAAAAPAVTASAPSEPPAGRTGAPPPVSLRAGGTDAPPVGEPRPSASKARAKFHDACRHHDAAAARRWLLAWLGAAWPEAPPTGLGAFAKQCADAALGAALSDLERACYAGGPWSGENLAVLLKDLPKMPSHGGPQAPPIAPLYR
ncbi:MAG: hypothetical protein KGI55_01315 [Gammaproteobacteria bacterium]|nr:hypothetical protein [Gammaproteobacteria bacterium]